MKLLHAVMGIVIIGEVSVLLSFGWAGVGMIILISGFVLYLYLKGDKK